MRPLLPPLALAFALAGCNAPAPGPDAEGAPADGMPSDSMPADSAPAGNAPADNAAQPGESTLPPATPSPGGDDPDGDDGIDDGDAGEGPANGGVAVIPQPYRGEWNSDPAACGTGNSDSRLVVGEDSLRFHESSGPVQSARMDGNELVVVVRLTGEGETRDATYRVRLSADGNTLTDAGSGLARQRCD